MENPFVESWRKDPFFKFTLEEKSKMSPEEFKALLKESNKYVRSEFERLKDLKKPKFNTVEELRTYYHCRPLEEVVKGMDKHFNY